MMQLEREISLRVGWLAITCKLTAVLSTNRYVEKGYFMACFPFNRELATDRWLNAIQVILQGCTRPDLTVAHTSSTGVLNLKNQGWTRMVNKARCSRVSITRLATTAVLKDYRNSIISATDQVV